MILPTANIARESEVIDRELPRVTSEENRYLGGYIGNLQFEESKKRFTQSLRGGPDDTSTA